MVGFEIVIDNRVCHQFRFDHTATQEALEEPVAGKEVADQTRTEQTQHEWWSSRIQRRIHNDEFPHLARVTQSVQRRNHSAKFVPGQNSVVEVKVGNKLTELSDIGIKAIRLVLWLL